MNSFRSLILFGLLLSFALSSCKTFQPLAGSSALPALDAEAILDSTFRKSQFNYLSAKINVTYQTENDTKNFSVRARLKKDSVIWLSVTPAMGIEVFRLCLTPDSVKMLNRMDQKFITSTFEEANELLKLKEDFSVIQSVLTGAFTKVYDMSDYASSIVGDHYVLAANPSEVNPEKAASPIEHISDISPQNWRVTKTFLNSEATGDQIVATYGGFEPVGTMMFPTEMQFNLQGKGKLSIELKWSKVEESDSLKFPFNIPNKYVAY
ncbi:MAG: DUF4292 domain-containing protein [Flavobacteriales bacterium]|nr:DUF4292 domain-containing protein [Flavobacteriales bacterium]